ncbi:transcription factor bHLH79-like [Helianthus annuus]|uniref:transcription factor bHLH79-like n=1 Tax=Helianthus annuus TaxID=4232 RepID=UPI000B8FC879|nr:transcription factor bHLH79-like [Helianthus annuus]
MKLLCLSNSIFMDPPIITESTFSAANPSSYSLTGIWPFNDTRIKDLGLKMGTLITPIGDPNTNNNNNPDDESTLTEYSGGDGRKRRDPNFENEGSKIVSTSSAIDLIENGYNENEDAKEELSD